MLLNWGDAWELDESVCPADLHLIDWIKHRDIKNASIFHMGTGAHHRLGVTMASNGSENLVMGITACPEEYKRFLDQMIENPFIGRCYKPFFGDIYQLDARQLPEFDIVSVFHLGEFSNEIRHGILGLTDVEVLDMLITRLKQDGHAVFYKNSFGLKFIKGAVDSRFEVVEEYKTLLICKVMSR
jgi:hypothetical protein